jgi:4-amino-4-deoxy-L-arabinose transferase-like glycosyltransferase
MLTPLKQSRHSLTFSFSLITVVLLLLYFWTLTETISFTVKVQDGECMAFLEERSNHIACPNLEGGEAGFYLTPTPLDQKLRDRPLDLLAPGMVLKDIRLAVAGKAVKAIQVFNGRDTVPDEVATWSIPDGQPLVIEARVERPDGGQAGILLIQPGSNNGWIFQVDSNNREAVWRRWQDGRPAATAIGIPFQKPLLAQAQSFLRQIIGTFIGALVIMFILAIVQRAGRLASQRVSVSAFPWPTFNSHPSTLNFPGQITTLPLATLQNLFFTLIIVLSVFAVTLWIAVNLLERIPHVQDSITYLFQAQTLARGALWAPEPPLPEAFSQEFLTVWDGKWFGQYPPGYPVVLAIGVLAGAPWLVNPILASLTVVLIIKLGMLLYRPSTGLLAGGLALLSSFFIFLSASLMVHTAELFWVVLIMVSWTLALQKPLRKRWALLAGAALGMLLLTRQITAVIIGISFVTLMFLLANRAQHVGSLQNWKQGLSRQAAILLGSAMPFILLLLGYQALLTGSPWQDPRLLSRPFDLPGFGSHIGESENKFKLHAWEETTSKTWYTDPQQPPRGHSPARGLYNTERNLTSLASTLFGWPPLIALAFCWIPFLLGKPTKFDWVLLAVLLVVMTVYNAYWTTGIMYGPRYYFAALPALLLLTARGLQTLQDRFGSMAAGMVFAVIVVLTLVFYWPGALYSMRDYNFINGQEKSLVEEQVEEPALVFIPVTDWWDYGRFFSGNTPWLDGPIIYARDLGDEQNECLRQAFPQRAVYLWQWESKSTTTIDLANAKPVCYNFHK